MNENIDKKLLLKVKTIFFIIISIVLFSITILRYLTSKNDNNILPNYTTEEDISQENGDIVNNYDVPLYIVTEYNGVITVFIGDEILDIMLSTVEVNSLPEADQELIYAGVDFDNYKDLIAFLENFE